MYKPPLSSLAPYMYEAWYDTIDYAYAYQWFRSHTPVVGGGCSTVRKGNLIGRNLDWTYSESAEFIVHTDGVVGVANAIPGLTDAFVQSGADDEIYKIVPFMLSDGMNKHGLVVSTLVVPTDKGDNSVVRPLDRSTRMMCTLMLPRYALDNFKTAQGAAYYFSSNVTLYHPKTLQDQHYDQHFVIADADDTFCMEFVEGRYVIKDISSKPFVTNFHLTGVEFNADGSVNTPASGKASDNKITPNGSGLERYNLINSYTGSVWSLMRELAYTRAYQSSPNPAVPRWDTEFVGVGLTLTVDSPTSEFDYIQSEAARLYIHRSRVLEDTWQTVHLAVYNVQEKKLRLYAQENYDTYWEVLVMADQTHVQHLRGDTAKNDAFTGSAGEITFDTQVKTLRVHDGVKEGGYELVNTSSAQTITGAKTFTTAPEVPLASSGDVSMKVANTSFVANEIATAIAGGIPQPATAAPKAPAVSAAVGTATKYAREDHVHPLQTSGWTVSLMGSRTTTGSWSITNVKPSIPLYIVNIENTLGVFEFNVLSGAEATGSIPLGNISGVRRSSTAVILPTSSTVSINVMTVSGSSGAKAFQ